MSWLDDFYRIVGKGDVRDSDFFATAKASTAPNVADT